MKTKQTHSHKQSAKKRESEKGGRGAVPPRRRDIYRVKWAAGKSQRWEWGDPKQGERDFCLVTIFCECNVSVAKSVLSVESRGF